MRFWIKIGLLTGSAYVACNVAFLWQDREEHHVQVAEVEAITRAAFREVQSGSCSPCCLSRLAEAQHRLALSDARWERHARCLGLMSIDF